MVKKEFTLRGKTLEELKQMTLEHLAEILPARQRRKLKRGLAENEKKFIKDVGKNTSDKPIRTHLRSMIILPVFVGKRFAVHDGKDWNVIEVKPEMIGHYLGEFSITRERVQHSGPGVGATRGTKFISVK
jgi:small subunit ribosomal protein S19